MKIIIFFLVLNQIFFIQTVKIRDGGDSKLKQEPLDYKKLIKNLNKNVKSSLQNKNLQIFQNAPQFRSINTNEISRQQIDDKNDQDSELPFFKLKEQIYTYVRLIQKYKKEQRNKNNDGDDDSDFLGFSKKKKVQNVDEKKKSAALKYIDQPYKFCIYPQHDINSNTYCEYIYKKQTEVKLMNECKHMMCTNCCNFIKSMMTSVSQKFNTSFALGFYGKMGEKKIQNIFSNEIVSQCKTDCQIEYPTMDTSVNHVDSRIGLSRNNPANSCHQIKKMNPRSVSGYIYYLKLANGTSQRAYCDMQSEGGGWTLFLSYQHNQNKSCDFKYGLPSDPNFGRAYINLKDVIKNMSEIGELKFQCSTEHKKQYISFITENPSLIKTAYTGDQKNLQPGPLQNITIYPKELEKNYLNLNVTNIKSVGNDSTGGLWNSPLIFDEGQRWTVRGVQSKNSYFKFECGDSLSQENGLLYKTNHQIWFREKTKKDDIIPNPIPINPIPVPDPIPCSNPPCYKPSDDFGSFDTENC